MCYPVVLVIIRGVQSYVSTHRAVLVITVVVSHVSTHPAVLVIIHSVQSGVNTRRAAGR